MYEGREREQVCYRDARSRLERRKSVDEDMFKRNSQYQRRKIIKTKRKKKETKKPRKTQINA